MQNNPVTAALQKFKFNSFLIAITELVLGIFLILNPNASKNALSMIFGAMVFLYGVFNIISYFSEHTSYSDAIRLVIGCATALLGIIFIISPSLLFDFIGTLVGLFIMIGGINQIQRSMVLRRIGYSHWFLSLLSGILIIALGLSFIFFSNIYGKLHMIFMGIMLIYEAVTDILISMQIHRLNKA